jgi:hypothetical protein
MSQSNRFVESLEGRSLFNGTISGLVHNDINGSGLADEFALTPRTTVYIDANENGRRDRGERSAVTDVNGRYTFTNVPGGRHHVRADLPEGFVPSNTTATGGKAVIFRGDAEVKIPTMTIRYRTAPWAGVGQNAQHDGISPFPGGPISQAEEVTQTPAAGQTTDPDAGTKFGTPVVTKFNTVIVPVLTDNGKYAVRAFSRLAGSLLWTFESDFVAPPEILRATNGQLTAEGVAAVFQPALDAEGRLYVPGAGGTVHMIGAPDRFGTLGGSTTNPTRTITARRLVFYGAENYVETKKGLGAKAKKFNKSVFINTGLTVGPDGNVYFGVDGTTKNNPLGLGSCLARVRPDGSGARVGADVVTGSTPALTEDGRYAYVATQERKDGVTTARLERFATGSMSRAGSVVLKDPSRANRRVTLRQGTYAMPMVAPDGDVYYVVPGTRSAQTDLDNGWLLRFGGDLSKQKMSAVATTGQTVSVVPTSMVQGYRGTSSYLVAAVYNSQGGAGLPVRLALFDPNRSGERRASGVAVMREQTSIGAQQGWISRPIAVDPSSGSIFAVNQNKQLVRWNVSDVTDVGGSVTLGETGTYGPGMSVVIGPDGQVYAVVSGAMYAAF